jgi:hypothetical protein
LRATKLSIGANPTYQEQHVVDGDIGDSGKTRQFAASRMVSARGEKSGLTICLNSCIFRRSKFGISEVDIFPWFNELNGGVVI